MTKVQISTLIFSIGVFFSLQAQNVNTEKGDKQFELNNFEGAIQSYQKTLKNAPESDVVQAKIGETYRKMGKIDDAIQWYEKAATKGDDAIVLQLAKLHIRKGNYTKAKSILEPIAAKNADAKVYLENLNDLTPFLTEKTLYQVTNLSFINTQFDDFFPTFTNTGEVVYLSSRNDVQRKGAKTLVGSNQLFSFTYDGENFSKPKFFNTDLKNTFNEGPIAMTNNYAVLTQNNFIGGIAPMETKGLELSMRKAIVDKTGHWQSSQSLNLGGEGYANGFATLSEDGQTLVFSSDRPGGVGGFDLWKCTKQGDGWSVPIPLGELNTPGNEITPHLSGNDLYFASDMLTGFGGYDVFKATLSGGIYGDISNLGNQVNSSYDDYGFVWDETRFIGFFSSNRSGGKGGEDLYFANKTSKAYTFNCIDEDGKPLANAKIDLAPCDSKPIMTNANGKATIQINGNKSCEAIVSKEGYVSTNFQLVTTSAKYQNQTITLAKAAMPYLGTVMDIDGNLLKEVIIKATNLNSNKSITAQSDDNGKYALNLEPNNSYVLLFSKAGFINMTETKNNIDAKNKDLGTMKLRTVATAYSVNETLVSKGAAINNRAKFTIQLAAVKDKNADLSKYQTDLAKIGEVYLSENDNGIYRIKLGKFATREAALSALEAVKTAGYQGIISPVLGITTKSAPPTPLAQNTSIGKYFIRLVALTKPENFEEDKVNKIGKITKYQVGAATVFLLADYATVEEATVAKLSAMKAGFKDAFIVEKIGDKYVKVEQ
jgi:hypothetical protein